MMSSGPFTWLPGQTREIEFFVTWARGSSNLDSISRVKGIAKGLIDAPEFFAPNVTVDEVPPEGGLRYIGFHHAYPNPAGERATIEYTVTDQALVSISLFDVR